MTALLLGACAAPWPSASRLPVPVATVSIELAPYFRGLKTASVTVRGRPRTFLVDTAGGRTSVSPQLALEFGCTPRGRDFGYRMTGEAVAFQDCPQFTAWAGPWQVMLDPVGVFDVNALLPAELPRLDGVLALDAFRGQVISLDWALARIDVLAPADAGPAFARDGLPVRIATGENGSAVATLVPVHAKTRLLWFLVDTGNIRSTLVARHVVDDHDLPAPDGDTLALAIGRRPSETLPVELDDIHFDGVLGTEYLARHRLVIDLRRAP